MSDLNCPDCGGPTTTALCGGCTAVASAFGLTVDQRLALLNRAQTGATNG